MQPPSLTAKLIATLFGLVLAFTLGEIIATVAMRGAYPTLNLYEPDAVYGVVLTPGAETRVASPLGTLTDFRTNALGFRGDEWPEGLAPALPVPGRVLIVGDSQVMGWGVPEEAAFPALLRDAEHEVLAAGVPSWGPGEYARAVHDLVPRFRPERVLFVVNAANDWQEAGVPNVRRTTARDGWAVVPTGDRDAGVTDFPLRRFLLGRSHIVLAVRVLIDPPTQGMPASVARRFMSELPNHAKPDGDRRSKLTRFIEAARTICGRYGCELVPVLLPADLQVHPGEWKKYGAPLQDARPTFTLATALKADVPDLIDLMPALVRASPGAFLPDDYHLSPAGHAAVAAALRPVLDGGAAR